MNRVRVPRDNQAELLIANTALFCFFFSRLLALCRRRTNRAFDSGAFLSRRSIRRDHRSRGLSPGRLLEVSREAGRARYPLFDHGPARAQWKAFVRSDPGGHPDPTAKPSRSQDCSQTTCGAVRGSVPCPVPDLTSWLLNFLSAKAKP